MHDSERSCTRQQQQIIIHMGGHIIQWRDEEGSSLMEQRRGEQDREGGNFGLRYDGWNEVTDGWMERGRARNMYAAIKRANGEE